MTGALRAAAVAAVIALGGAPSLHAASVQVLRFDELRGWAADDHDAALEVFLETCPDLDDPDWAPLCALAQGRPEARPFFEMFFRPVLIGGESPALFTGYYEPELNGARRPDARFRYPLYRKPPELAAGAQWYPRADIEDRALLEGRGLEIVWVDDPVELFFLQVQGSGRVRLRDGGAMRVGYGGSNGHDYRSIGAELVRRGVYARHQVSAQVIKNWVRRNPDDGRSLLRHNPSYVFFRELTDVPADKGPLGAMNRSVTPMRTLAVDPEFTPLGAPVWIEKGGARPLRRLMVAQDTGSAIKGAQRADIFYGTGVAAGRLAGRVRDPGRMVVLLPIEKALTLAPGG
ncbi:MltA domain-containing protein [Actibacterium sp. MT2.3-13A]|uniref:murein transglycosylase A n=1 Tax=Actibacterium sp. MT2.3-13A TaxID=2828332 RepID=UPI001BA84504|nr:MltA domain-containing protein [Actibacterium sp. MT2.3-13A]